MQRSKTRKKRLAVMRFRPSLFWDVNPKKIDPKKNAVYIIERIMDFGNDDEVRWMVRNYSKKQLREVASRSRVLHPPSRAFWQLLTKS